MREDVVCYGSIATIVMWELFAEIDVGEGRRDGRGGEQVIRGKDSGWNDLLGFLVGRFGSHVGVWVEDVGGDGVCSGSRILATRP
jgi:hypothetical protein